MKITVAGHAQKPHPHDAQDKVTYVGLGKGLIRWELHDAQNLGAKPGPRGTPSPRDPRGGGIVSLRGRSVGQGGV